MEERLEEEVRSRCTANPRLLGALLSDVFDARRYPEYLCGIVAEFGGTAEEALATHLKQRAAVVGWAL